MTQYNETQIRVGGRLVTIPGGYLNAEAEYVKIEAYAFDNTPVGPKKEIARAAALEKRVEFYELFLAGKATITPIIPPKILPLWRRIIRWSIGERF